MLWLFQSSSSCASKRDRQWGRQWSRQRNRQLCAKSGAAEEHQQWTSKGHSLLFVCNRTIECAEGSVRANQFGWNFVTSCHHFALVQIVSTMEWTPARIRLFVWAVWTCTRRARGFCAPQAVKCVEHVGFVPQGVQTVATCPGALALSLEY